MFWCGWVYFLDGPLAVVLCCVFKKGLLKSFHLVETQEHSCQNDCSRMSKLLFSMQWQWIHTAELQKWPETSSLLVIISVWDMDTIFVIEKSEIKWNKVSCLPRKKSSIRSWSIIRFAKIIGQVWNYYLISNISHPFLTFIYISILSLNLNVRSRRKSQEKQVQKSVFALLLILYWRNKWDVRELNCDLF